MKVLIVLEDPILDRYIAKPVIERILRSFRGSHSVFVMTDPRFRGISQALDADLCRRVITKHGWRYDVFLWLVDRDCNRTRNTEQRLGQLQALAREQGALLVGQCAIEELEVWLPAAFHDEINAPWAEVRRECDPKERFMPALINARGVSLDGPSKGASPLMREALRRFKGIRSRCKEIDHLAARLESCAAGTFPSEDIYTE